MKLLLLAIALPQAPAPAGSIRGIVLTETGEPVYAARVELLGSSQSPLVARTDAEGGFAFGDLIPGVYRLSVKKEGFVRQEYGQKKPGGGSTPILIESGNAVSGITMRLRPAATIAGEVRNEEGFPIADILVQALRAGYDVRGNRTVTLFSSTLTDDLGAYSLYWVDPGNYYVNASYLPQLPTAVDANEDAPRAAYAPTYFPGTSDPAAAELVHFQSTKELSSVETKSKNASLKATVLIKVPGGELRSG